MIDWSLYKGSDTERSKKAYIGFVKLLDKEGYILLGEYKGTMNKVKVECNKKHIYEVTPSNFKQGSRCPICSGKCSKTAKENFIKQVEDEGYKLVGEYKSALTKVEIQCNEGHKYFVIPSKFKIGRRCPICAGQHLETAKLEFIKQVESENYKLLGEYINNRTKVEIQCDKGHRYFVIPSSFKQGYRCPICSGNHPETAKLNFVKQVNEEGYKLIGDYVNVTTKVELECDREHKYFVIPSSFKSGRRCPHCNAISHGERLTRKILEECKLGFEQQKKFDGLIGVNGGKLSYDFFVEGYLLIEIQGEQHYKPLDLFGGEERFKQQQEHDRLKREFAINNGYKLLEIPYFSPRDLDNLENTLRVELNNILVLEEVS